MANPFDQFDAAESNPFDQFDKGAKRMVTPKGQQPDLPATSPEYQKIKSRFLAQETGKPYMTAMHTAAPVQPKPKTYLQRLADPENLKAYKEYLESPTERPSTLGEFAGKVVPESGLKTAYGTLTAPYQAIKSVTDPLLQGDIKGAGEAGVSTLAGVVDFLATRMGAKGGEAFKEAFLTDPVGTASVLAPMIKGGISARTAPKQVGLGGVTKLPEYKPPQYLSEAEKLGKQFDVPLTAGEELASPNLKQIEAKLERLPLLGIRGTRKAQVTKLAEGAARIADEFSTGAEDPATSLLDKFKSNLKRGKELSSAAYTKIDEELASVGTKGEIETIQTRGTLRDLLSKSPDIFERLPGSQARMKSIMQEISGELAPKAEKSLILDESGRPVQRQVTHKLSYDDYKWLRDQLGEYIGRSKKAAGAVGSNELRQLTIIKKALDNDFYRWGKRSGYENVTKAVDDARQVYKDNVAPFENSRVLSTLMDDNFTSEQLIDLIAKPGEASRAIQAMKGLKHGGVELVKDAIMRRALAIATEGGKEGAPFSPAKFATFFEKLDTKTKNAARTPMDVFYGEDKPYIMGFAKLARIAERSGQYQANPLTGVAAADFAIPSAIGGAATLVGLPTGISLAATTKTLSLMLTTERGKSLLRKAYHLPENAKAAWSKLSNEISDYLKQKRRP